MKLSKARSMVVAEGFLTRLSKVLEFGKNPGIKLATVGIDHKGPNWKGITDHYKLAKAVVGALDDLPGILGRYDIHAVPDKVMFNPGTQRFYIDLDISSLIGFDKSDLQAITISAHGDVVMEEEVDRRNTSFTALSAVVKSFANRLKAAGLNCYISIVKPGVMRISLDFGDRQKNVMDAMQAKGHNMERDPNQIDQRAHMTPEELTQAVLKRKVGIDDLMDDELLTVGFELGVSTTRDGELGERDLEKLKRLIVQEIAKDTTAIKGMSATEIIAIAKKGAKIDDLTHGMSTEQIIAVIKELGGKPVMRRDTTGSSGKVMRETLDKQFKLLIRQEIAATDVDARKKLKSGTLVTALYTGKIKVEELADDEIETALKSMQHWKTGDSMPVDPDPAKRRQAVVDRIAIEGMKTLTPAQIIQLVRRGVIDGSGVYQKLQALTVKVIRQFEDVRSNDPAAMAKQIDDIAKSSRRPPTDVKVLIQSLINSLKAPAKKAGFDDGYVKTTIEDIVASNPRSSGEDDRGYVARIMSMAKDDLGIGIGKSVNFAKILIEVKKIFGSRPEPELMKVIHDVVEANPQKPGENDNEYTIRMATDAITKINGGTP